MFRTCSIFDLPFSEPISETECTDPQEVRQSVISMYSALMQPAEKIRYMALSAISTIALALATAFIINGMTHDAPLQTRFYRSAFYTFIVLIALIKLRVQMGFRIPRGTLFHIHLASAISLFFSLALLAFWAQPTWLEYLMWALYATALVTGTVLFYRGTMRALLAN